MNQITMAENEQHTTRLKLGHSIKWSLVIRSFKKFFYSGNAFSKFYDSGIGFIELTLATKSKWVYCHVFDNSSLKILPEYITNNRTCLIENGKFTIDTLLSKSFHRFQIDLRDWADKNL